jgi:HD superfamily phosphohydrolase
VTPRPLWLGLPKLLGVVSAQLQEAFGTELDAYVGRVRLAERPTTAKVINDPVWRTVRVEGWELPVIDSPIFQRLRHIHQLGLAGLVFPGANYSRFEHSIGVLHQVQRLIEAINRNARAYADRRRVPPVIRVRPQDEVILRLAGLLHDVGHGFFSHVSERVMSRFASIDGLGSISAFRIEAQNYFRTTSVPAVAEILSSLMVLLPEFGDVLELAQPPMWQDAPGELARRIAQLIAGGRSPTRPFLTEIISGALDADKLDYMPRDCYMAGLPMPVDVDRLLEKIQVVSVRADRLPPAYAERYGLGSADNVEILAVQTGGARAFEELVVSRVLLYDKLYNHQKIRALEGMVENALDLLGSSTTAFRHFSTFLRMTDANFMSGQWPDEKSDADRYRQAQEIVGRISRRQAYVRAFAFGPGLISSPDPRDPANDAMIRRNWATLRPLVSRNRNTEALEFRREVVQLAREYLIAIGQSGLAGELAEHHMVIDLPDVQGIAEKTRFYVGDEDYGVELYNRRFRVERWAEAYENQVRQKKSWVDSGSGSLPSE